MSEQKPSKTPVKISLGTAKLRQALEKPKPLVSTSRNTLFESTETAPNSHKAIHISELSSSEPQHPAQQQVATEQKKVIVISENKLADERKKLTESEESKSKSEKFYDTKKFGLQKPSTTSNPASLSSPDTTLSSVIALRKKGKLQKFTSDEDIFHHEMSLLSDRPVEYEDVSVDEFGDALLRGMGWQEGRGIGKRPMTALIEPVQLTARPARLGLGAGKGPAVAVVANVEPEKNSADDISKIN